MVGSLAIALIGVVSIVAVWAAPVSENKGVIATTSNKFILEKKVDLNLVSARILSDAVQQVLTSNSEEKEEAESALPLDQHTTTTGNSTAETLRDTSSEQLQTSTTEHPHNAIGRIFSPRRDKPGRIAFAGGVHQYRVRHDEDENKRALEEYNYHFVRVEKGLSSTTKRSGNK